jgi:hypothetical protein
MENNTANEPKANRKHKDSVFTKLFGKCLNPDWPGLPAYGSSVATLGVEDLLNAI